MGSAYPRCVERKGFLNAYVSARRADTGPYKAAPALKPPARALSAFSIRPRAILSVFLHSASSFSSKRSSGTTSWVSLKNVSHY